MVIDEQRGAGPGTEAAPGCAICGGGGRDGVAPLPLAGGFAVWLCRGHRSEAFARREGGRALAEALRGVWASAGCLTVARERALEAHVRRMAGPPGRAGRRPGSYAWAGLRREAELRWAAGMPPGEVIAELRAALAAEAGPGGPTGPSVATMRRWYREGRWREAI